MYRKKTKGLLKHIDFIIWDIFCLQISFLLAYMIRHGYRNMYEVGLYRNMAMVLILIDVASISFFNTLKNVLKRGYYIEFVKTLQQVASVVMLATFYLFATQEGGQFSRITLFWMACIYLPLSYLIRLLWKASLKKRGTGTSLNSILVITDSNDANKLVEQMKYDHYEQTYIAHLAIIDVDMEGQKVGGLSVVANKDNLIDYLCREWIDEVFIFEISDEEVETKLTDSLIEMGIVVHTKLAQNIFTDGKRQFVERMGGFTVLTTSINSVSLTEQILKRLLDIVGGIVGCIFTGILFIFLAPAIYIQSPGPIFFSQIRVGKNGKKFKIYKFRSMYLDAEERKKELLEKNRVKDGMMFKLDFDPRIIGSKKLEDGTIKKGIGNWIRDWSFDEFPQFYNVLKGDMSLVGTRPPTVDEWDKYEMHHRARLATKPGLTGMWQVSGRSKITDFEEVVKLDRKYIAEWSIGLDLRILLKTIKVVFTKDGSM